MIPSTGTPSIVDPQYIARYVLALDYFYFTNYNRTHSLTDDDDIEHQQHPPFMNFITSGIDICQWNYRTGSSINSTTGSYTNSNVGIQNRTIEMGVTCDSVTKLPINFTISTCLCAFVVLPVFSSFFF
jgi:hypothetical protein